MTALRRGLRFVAGQQGLLGPAPAPEAIDLAGRDADVYEPLAPYAGTIVTIHGMSPLGQRDPRMHALHGALVRMGVRVVAPSFPSIAALRMHAGQLDDIEHAIHGVCEHPELAPQGRVGLFSVSFSAGMSLVAASRPRIAHRLSGVCAIGSFGDIRETMAAVLTREDLTTYAWKIVLANFLYASVGDCPRVRDVLLTAALDEWWERERPEVGAALAALPSDEAALARQILLSPEVRRYHFRRIVAAQPRMLELASVVDHVGRLQAPVTLLHGRGDATIPASQTRTLARALKAAQVPHRAVITPLLGHGEARWSMRDMAAAPALLRAFGAFFEDCDPRRARRKVGWWVTAPA